MRPDGTFRHSHWLKIITALLLRLASVTGYTAIDYQSLCPADAAPSFVAPTVGVAEALAVFDHNAKQNSLAFD